MWHYKTHLEAACEQCGHRIGSGELCFSEVPYLAQEVLQPELFRYFHVDCEQCGRGRTCYETYAEQSSPFVSQVNLPCLFCGHAVQQGELIHLESVFCLAWQQKPSHEPDANSAKGIVATLLGSTRRATNFSNWSNAAKNRFVFGGLGKSRGWRSTAGAQDFLRSSIPRSIRNLGEGAVLKFIKGKHASHIESVANAPTKARVSGNIIWEPGKWNELRGPRNMTGAERLRVRTYNGAHTVNIITQKVIASAGRAAGIAALVEAVVSTTENVIHVKKGTKNREEAIRDTTKNVGQAALFGGAAGSAIIVLTATGVFSVIAPIVPVVSLAGLGLLGYSSVQRIRYALEDTGLPLVPTPVYFHSKCSICDDDQSCYTRFARNNPDS